MRMSDIVNNFIRKEQKYISNKWISDKFIDLSSDIISLDTIGYVNTFYFDTKIYNSFVESIHHKENRFKVRLRKYDINSDYCFIELKSKNASGLSKKQRYYVTDTLANKIVGFNSICDMKIVDEVYKLNSKSNKKEIEEMIMPIVDSNLYPTLQSSYHRSAYINSDLNNLRITIDNDVKYIIPTEFKWEFDRDSMKSPNYILNDDHSIIEIKYFDNLSLRISSIISKLKLNKVSFSKYVNLILDDLLVYKIKTE